MTDCPHHLIHYGGYVYCNKCGREWHLGNIYAREDDGSEWIMLEPYLPRVEKDREPPDPKPPAAAVDLTRHISEWAKKTGGRYDSP